MTKLTKNLKHIVDLQLPYFKRTVPPGSVYQLSFDEHVTEDWYKEFYEQIQEAIGKRYLPIYRMADGEFIFCVGRKADLPAQNASVKERMWLLLKGIVPQWLSGKAKKDVTCWGEQYTDISRKELMERYIECLKIIAANGLLAIHFTRTVGRFSEQYLEPMCQWFEAHQIPVTKQNYVPFYFVYALLSGPERYLLFSGRRVLVVTSADPEKRKRIAQGLKQIGAQNVQFASVSPHQSLMDKLDLSSVSLPVDVVLVAAGIGSANVLCQLNLFNTVCIDAGICVEALADSSQRARIFMVPDDERGYSV